jgi:hypothetical protein
MEIKGPRGLYTIRYDAVRKICYEVPVGLWTKEDYQIYHNDYVSKIGPLLNGKWAKIVDLRQYKTSDITEEINKHSKWMMSTGCNTLAFIVESAIVKMQMNNAGAGTFQQQAFTDEKEAYEWLKSKGF